MLRTFVSLFFVFLYGCSSVVESMLSPIYRPMTAEQKEALVERSKLVKEHTVEPIYSLIRETCKFHVSKGEWPKLREQDATAGYFEYLKIIESDVENIEMELKLTTVNAPTKIVIAFNKEAAKENAPYEFNLESKFEAGDFNLSSNFSCAGPGFNNDELLIIATKVTPVLEKYKAMNELNKSTPSTPVSKQAVDVGAQLLICALLKLEPSQCK